VTTSISSLAPLVAVDAPNCPTPVVEWAIRAAAQDFYRDTEAWRIEGNPITTADSATVDIDLPLGTHIGAVYNVYAGDRLIPSGAPSAAAALSSGGVWMTATDDEIKMYWVDSPTALRVYPINTVPVGVSVFCSVIPAQNATSLPTLSGDYTQTIVSGALWKLQQQQGKAWSNDAAAQTNGLLFNAGCVRAKIATNRSGNASMRIAFRSV